ncbi:MAG TPA: hypothetical protein VHA09_08500 [Nitrososphaera sp.]|nr:hypothetical protein [Nitrososphaera sp.]
MAGKGGKGSKRDESYFAASRRKKRRNMMIIIPIIAAVVAISVISALLYKPPPAQAAISGVECHSTEVTNYHVHSHLDVYVDGQKQELPSGIGIKTSPPSCLFWLHTHDASGMVHVEAPEKKDFTLGQFIDIWNQTYTQSKPFFEGVAGKPITAYVNGTQVTDYRSIPLESRKEIVLVFGKSPSELPTFDFGNWDIGQ